MHSASEVHILREAVLTLVPKTIVNLSDGPQHNVRL